MQVTAEKLSEFGWFPSAVSVRLRECELLVVIDLLLTGETQAGDHDALTECLNVVLVLHGRRQAHVTPAYAVSSLALN